MCLVTIYPEKSNKDISCIKLLIKIQFENGEEKYVTPFYYKELSPSILEGKELLKPEEDEEKISYIYNSTHYSIDDIYNPNPETYIMISKGYIHVYNDTIDLNDLIMYIKNQCEYLGKDDPFYNAFIMHTKTSESEIKSNMNPIVKGVVLCECIIPANTEFYRGGIDTQSVKNHIWDNTAAKAIRINKIIHEFTLEEYQNYKIDEIIQDLFMVKNNLI